MKTRISRISRISLAAFVIPAFCALGAISLLITTAQAQTFPTKPVRLLVAFGAGGFSGRGIILIERNTVTRNGAGISFGDSGQLDFRAVDNVIDSNNGAGVRTQNIGSNARMEGNRVTNNRGGDIIATQYS